MLSFINFLKFSLNIGKRLFDLAVLIQIILGIITLISGVEIKYASLHQIGSIFVLCTYILILYKNTNQQPWPF